MARTATTALLLLTGLFAAAPAAAQFGSIFGDPPRPPNFGSIFGDPPRPPNTVPDGRLPSDRLPPGPPPGSRIQTQPLPPPPGASSAPPRAPAGAQQTTPAASPSGQRPQPAQRGPQPASTAPQPGDEVVVEPPARKVANPTAVFSGLDKITGRIISFDVAINETVRFGALEVTPRACYTRPPTEAPQTDGFLEVDELTLQGELKRIFTGWMFAASPGLNAVEHPIYDIWLTDCKGAPQSVADVPPPQTPTPQARPPQRPAQPQQTQQRPLQQPRPNQPLPPPPVR